MDTSTFIRPLQLLEALGPASHGEDVGAIIVDLAAGGMIRASAHFVDDHYHVDHQPQPDCEIRSDQWQRIVHQGHVSDVWKTGTVRLNGDAKNHLCYLEIVGIRFDEIQVREALARYGLDFRKTKTPTVGKQDKSKVQSTDAGALEVAPTKPLPLLDAVEGISIAQTMVILNLGRTTIDKLKKNGTLEHMKIGGRTIIKTDSVRRLLGRP